MTPATDCFADENLSSFNLDLDRGLNVRSVAVDGRPARWTRTGGELTITPRKGLRKRDDFKTVIVYDSPPPPGLQAIANGELKDVDKGRRTTTWEWKAKEPMASSHDGDDRRVSSGRRFAISQISEPSYKRLTRTLSVPAVAGGRVSFWVQRDTEPNWDFFFVEAHTVGHISVSFGPGSTSFESGLEGWTVSGPPAGSDPNPNDWIVDDAVGLGFALENQTRPIYSKVFWDIRSELTDSVVVHELAHQWVGDDLALSAWQHIWLNEGFATYSEWLWSEHKDRATAQRCAGRSATQPSSACCAIGCGPTAAATSRSRSSSR